MAKVDVLQQANVQRALETFEASIIDAEEMRDIVPATIEELELGSARANKVAKVVREIEAFRQEMKKPFLEGGRMIDRLFKPFLERTQGLINTIRGNNKQFTDAEAKRRHEEVLKAQAIENGRRAAQEKRRAKGMDTKPDEQIAPVARPVTLRAETSVRMVKTHKHELEDFYKVPAEYLKPGWQQAALDTARIRSAQAAHNKEIEAAKKDNKPEPEPLVIAGLKLWTEEKPY